MPLLESENIRLRALEPEDVDLLYRWENDTRVWGVSHTLLPFSRHLLRQFIEDQAHDIFHTKQTRLVIETKEESQTVGLVDLFDFDPFHLRAGVGILIHSPQNRGMGYASEALSILKRYAFEVLRLHQLWCNIGADNLPSIRLFEKHGFTRAGRKRRWLRTAEGWTDEVFYQLIDADAVSRDE